MGGDGGSAGYTTGGYNGGGGAQRGNTGTGGGATDIRTSQSDLSSRILVAGGGGGAGNGTGSGVFSETALIASPATLVSGGNVTLTATVDSR